MLILLAGDMHGDQTNLDAISHVCRERGILEIVQLGDFGVDGKFYDNHVGEVATNCNFHITVVPGNHENWDHIDALFGYVHRQSPLMNFAPKQLAKNIHTGHKLGYWTAYGLKCLFVGGTVSFDRAKRIPKFDWWEQESWSMFEMETGLAAIKALDKVDVVFSHDTLPEHPNRQKFGVKLTEDPACADHAKFMGMICDLVKPKLWVHGHMHSQCRYKRNNTDVVSLGCYDDDSLAVLDTVTLEVLMPIAPKWRSKWDLRKISQ